MLWPVCIMTPLHVHSARTEEDYRKAQVHFIARNKRDFPFLNWRDPFVAELKPEVLIEGGKWLVQCTCGNFPSVHPEWNLALCFECGAIYEGLTVPKKMDEIVAALLERPHPALRAWRQGETAEQLRAEHDHMVGVVEAEKQARIKAQKEKELPVMDKVDE